MYVLVAMIASGILSIWLMIIVHRMFVKLNALFLRIDRVTTALTKQIKEPKSVH